MITKQNLKRHELIGLRAEIVEARNKDLIGVKGKVVDETQKSLMLGEKRVLKKGAVFRFELPNHDAVTLSGDEIAFRPWERISK